MVLVSWKILLIMKTLTYIAETFIGIKFLMKKAKTMIGFSPNV